MQQQQELFTASCEGGCIKSAVFDASRKYRYELWRRWGEKDFCMFIGLNPSTADEIKDDPTIRRCIGFAKEWGYDALCMTNIYAFRATQPRDMFGEPEPIGPDNNATLVQIARQAGIVIAAWGSHGGHGGRGAEVAHMILAATAVKIKCLGVTKDGYPRHPLYLKKDSKPRPL